MRCPARPHQASPEYLSSQQPTQIVAFPRAPHRFRPLFTRQRGDLVIYWMMLFKPARRYRMNNSHSSALLARHAGLDARIVDEERRPAPDQGTIASLKKQKLKIKEALIGL